MNKKNFKNLEWNIIISSVILLAIGIVALFSASKNDGYDEFQKQVGWIVAGLIIFITIILLDYRRIIKFAPILYGISILSLIAVLFTDPINGASSWFNIGGFSLQPSEFAKVIFVLALSLLIVHIQQKDKQNINKFKMLGLVLLLTLLPVCLIILQPDYGTAVTFVVALIATIFVAGIKKRYILIGILIIVMLVPIIYFFILPEHAKTRIEIFFDPYQDPRGAGYNVIQSMIAIGSGEVIGMGIGNGNQTQLGYLYPKTTDFIFAVVSEEMGFIIAATLIMVYTNLIVSGIKIAKNASDSLGSYIAIGIVGIFLFHMVQNIGMTMGLLPITGVPLLFISYGGSSMITSFILIGILINIGLRKK